MGMDYVPVYEDEAEQDAGSVKISLDRLQRAGVRTEAVELRRLVRPVRAPGVVKFDERRLRAVSLRADAFVEKLYVNETGKSVKAGEPLFRIYSPQIVSAQVDYRSSASARSMTRDETLRGQQGAEQRLRNLDIPEPVIARLKASGETVMSIDWPSPATGVVIEKKVIEGQQIKMGDEVMRIADLDTVWVIADVAEHDLGLVKIGAPAVLTFHAFADKRVEGKVTFISPMLDAERPHRQGARRGAEPRSFAARRNVRRRRDRRRSKRSASGRGPRFRRHRQRQASGRAGGAGRRPVRAARRQAGRARRRLCRGQGRAERRANAWWFRPTSSSTSESNLKAALKSFTSDAPPRAAVAPGQT